MTIQECNQIVNEFSSYGKIVTYLDNKYKIDRIFLAPLEESFFGAFIDVYRAASNPESVSAVQYLSFSELMVLLDCTNVLTTKRTFLRYSDVSKQS